MRIDAEWLDTHEWMLRSSENGVSYGGFKWGRKGAWNKCPDWKDAPECGGGFHGNAPEAHGYGFDYGRVELHETRGKRVAIGSNKIKVPESRAVAYGAEIPDEAFERCGFSVAHDGDTISPKNGEAWIVPDGIVRVEAQAGGDCRAYGNATINASAQAGGSCRAYGNATINASAQARGDCYANNNATINASAQAGGSCYANDNATINASAQAGGSCYAYDNATINASAQAGGDCWANGNATINRRGGVQ